MLFLKSSFFLFSLLLSSVVYAKSSTSNLTISPIVGVERIQKLKPTPTMKSRTIFGVEAVYHLPIISFEAIYTHGQDSSYDAVTTTTYKDVDDKMKLGVRGSFGMGAFLSSYLKGGAQVKLSKQTRTVSGAASSTSSETKVNPYVGTGLTISVLNTFAITADVTAVYVPTSTAGLSDYEIQPSLGFSISI
jgi:hypothetical protein